MTITIRDTVESDLPDIFRIQTDPLVAIHQYRRTARDTSAAWRQQLFGDKRHAAFVFKCSTILNDREVVGHICRHHFQLGDWALCQCGFKSSRS